MLNYTSRHEKKRHYRDICPTPMALRRQERRGTKGISLLSWQYEGRRIEGGMREDTPGTFPLSVALYQKGVAKEGRHEMRVAS